VKNRIHVLARTYSNSNNYLSFLDNYSLAPSLVPNFLLKIYNNSRFPDLVPSLINNLRIVPKLLPKTHNNYLSFPDLVPSLLNSLRLVPNFLPKIYNNSNEISRL